MDDADNTLRVLVATDCHLGYMEKDEVRRFDSFQAFEEICSIAEHKQVDFILLGGDLFHENKPSRTTLIKTIEILRRHCLNDQPVQFQVVSDQTMNFQNIFGHVNYEDPHFNVGLPVFTIHGNHDDPAGVDNLSAIDILSACNLVNYFGKMVLGGTGVGQITLYPILIRKGTTSLALYGLGNIRDERLNRMFQTPHAVQWIRPEGQEDCDVSSWFNVLVLHQNRIKTNPKNSINEHFLPRFLDFIVWGHEHECLVDPQEVPGMGFHITQPGSSVATSLIDGEAKPKHVLLLEIKGNQYRPTKIPLTTVRPFEYTEVVLKDEADVDPNDQASILDFLDRVVRNLIEKAGKNIANKSEVKLPLVRIKVDYSGFMTINPQRFGQKYVGKVANPQDILIFSKTAKRRQSVEEKVVDSERLRPEELNQQNIEALVAESNLKMEILPVNDLDVALHDFVNKDDKFAFHSCLKHNLEETRNKLASESDKMTIEDEDLILKVEKCMQEHVEKRSLRPRESMQFTSSLQAVEDNRNKSISDAVTAFSDDGPTFPGSNSTGRGKKSSARPKSVQNFSEGVSTVASNRGKGRRSSGGLKQTTLDTAIFRHSGRSAAVSTSASIQTIGDDENLDGISSPESESHGTTEIEPETTRRSKRPARGRGRGTGKSVKRGKKSETSIVHDMFMNNNDDDDDDDDDDKPNRLKTVQPRVTRNYGSLLRKR